MLHIPYRTDSQDSFNNSGVSRELLNSHLYAKNNLLVVGPNVTKQKTAPPDGGHTHKYLELLLKAIVQWCVQENIIKQHDIIDDLRALLDKGAIIPAGYQIEEHLTTRQQKQECLRTVLHNHNQVQAIHYQLASFPFRGYITTCYDTCIETAYADSQHSQLSKFYQSSLTQAIDASRKRQPFILKLYGDLDDPDSINLGHRLLTGLYAIDVREQLRQLLSETSTIFIGFEQTDEDLVALQSLTRNRYIVHQKHPTFFRERPDDIITKPGEQSSSNYIAHELFPENYSPGHVISPRDKDVDFKEKQFEEKLIPNTGLPEPIGAGAFKAIAKDSNDSKDSKRRFKDADAIVPPSLPSFTPPGDTLDPGRQSITKNSAGTLDIQLSRKTFKDFFSLLNELNCQSEKQNKVNRLGKWCYDRVEVDRDEYWDLIYLSDELLTKPTQSDLLLINGLCTVFGKGAFLLVFHTMGNKLDIVIKQIITIDWLANVGVTARLVALEEIKQIMEKDEDTRLDLTKGLFVRHKRPL